MKGSLDALSAQDTTAKQSEEPKAPAIDILAPPSIPEAPKTKTEFDSIAPELVKNKPVVVGKSILQVKNRREPGVTCNIRPVRTKALLAIGRTLTGSVRPVNLYNMFAPIMEAQNDSQQWAGVTAAVAQLMVTVPHSEREFINLLNVLVDPDPSELKNKDDLNSFWEYMDDPDLEDTVSIISQMVANEKDRWVDLGKLLMTMFPNLRKQAEALEEAPVTP